LPKDVLQGQVHARPQFRITPSPEIREFEIVGSDAHRRFDLVQGQAVWDQAYVDELKASSMRSMVRTLDHWQMAQTVLRRFTRHRHKREGWMEDEQKKNV